MQFTELWDQQIPMGGCAYHLARSSKEGCAVARYLALTGKVLYGHDLLALGLVTHAVSEYPYETLAHAIAQTVNARYTPNPSLTLANPNLSLSNAFFVFIVK